MTDPRSRRRFLANAGLGALGAWLAPTLLTRRGRAQAGAPPKRFVLFLSRFGTIDSRWRMRPAGGAPSTTTAFDLDAIGGQDAWSEILSPLYPVREHVSVVEGLGQLAVLLGRDGDLGAIGHAPSAVTTATGASWFVPESERSRGSGDRATRTNAASIDQIIADATHGPGRLRHLALGQGGYRYAEGGAPVASEEDPAAVLDRLFPPTEPTDPEPDHGRARALELVEAEMADAASRLGSADRNRLEHHRRLVADLRGRLVGPARGACAAPTLGGDRHSDFFRLITTAFACDLTRTVSYHIGALPGPEFGQSSGINVHQDLAHRENGDPDNDASRTMAQMYRQMATRFGELVSMLAATPEPTRPEDSLLDHTALLWLTEQQDGEHAFLKCPYVVAGHCGGALSAGRYFYHQRDLRLSAFTRGAVRTVTTGPAHNHVLVSMAQAMGLSTDRVGLAEVEDLAGNRISCRGGVEGLASV